LLVLGRLIHSFPSRPADLPTNRVGQTLNPQLSSLGTLCDALIRLHRWKVQDLAETTSEATPSTKVAAV
jgi:hypothetical protein